jgi:hypothetical protein
VGGSATWEKKAAEAQGGIFPLKLLLAQSIKKEVILSTHFSVLE